MFILKFKKTLKHVNLPLVISQKYNPILHSKPY